MNKIFKEHITELSEIIGESTLLYFESKFKNKEQNISDLINLILSAYFSSMFILMEQITADNEKSRKVVARFKDNILDYISRQHPIVNVEKELMD